MLLGYHPSENMSFTGRLCFLIYYSPLLGFSKETKQTYINQVDPAERLVRFLCSPLIS